MGAGSHQAAGPYEEPGHPEEVVRFEELARSWEQRPLLKELGMSVRQIEPGRVVMAMERNGTNVSGVRDSINGGVQATFAELAAHVAIATLLGAGERVEATQDISVSYLHSATARWVMADAEVLRHGRLSVVDVELSVGIDGPGMPGRPRGGQLGPRAERQVNARARVTCALGRPAR